MTYYDDPERRRARAVAATILLFAAGVILIVLYFIMTQVLSGGSDSGYAQWDEMGEMFVNMGNILGVLGVLFIILGFVSAVYSALLVRRPRKKMPRKVLRPKYR
ncbi:MAG: hypothetical protein KAS60_08125 [Thermoplasmata archaeon]|nr:hypothetical protein [Candidatus Thermoplasmatota archaeon]MCK4950036.1 hypothetical protein [Thermoplasmata archaeon]